MIAEHLGVSTAAFREEMARRGSFLAAVDAMRTTGRSLRTFTDFMISADAGPLAENDLMDPDHVPSSLLHSVGSLAEGVVTWPLTRLFPGLMSFVRGVSSRTAG